MRLHEVQKLSLYPKHITMKLVVVGGSAAETGNISTLLTRLEKTGISHRMIVYTPSWRTCAEALDMHQDADIFFIPADSPVDFIKQLKRAGKTPLVFQDNKTGDFRLLNLRAAKGTVEFDSVEVSPAEDKVASLVRALNLPSAATTVQPAVTTGKRDRFVIRIASKLKPVSLEEIAYFYSDNRLNFLNTWEGQRFVINHSMEELVKNLPATDFFRISRSFIISYKSIEVIHIQDRNRLKVLLSPSFREDVFVSREKVTEFKQWIGE
jgi:hypothetical protein